MEICSFCQGVGDGFVDYEGWRWHTCPKCKGNGIVFVKETPNVKKEQQAKEIVMNKNINSEYLADSLDGELWDIEGLFNAMMKIENVDQSTVYDLGHIGETLTKKARENYRALCDAIARMIGDIEIIRKQGNCDDLMKIEGFNIEFRGTLHTLFKKENSPTHIEIIKKDDLETAYILSQIKPSSLVQREEGSEVDHADPADNSKVAQG